jgi:serine/threonine-protein kinase RsbW
MMVRLEFVSTYEMLDFVQIVTDHLSQRVGLDEDTRHYVGVAVRECVVNGITHGNRNDPAKHIFVEFSADNSDGAFELEIRVRDQGAGFDPAAIADPLAPENLLKASGRGIFLIRSFMDDVQLLTAPGGGMEIRMTKRGPTDSHSGASA